MSARQLGSARKHLGELKNVLHNDASTPFREVGRVLVKKESLLRSSSKNAFKSPSTPFRDIDGVSVKDGHGAGIFTSSAKTGFKSPTLHSEVMR